MTIWERRLWWFYRRIMQQTGGKETKARVESRRKESWKLN
uniref:Uncharacterized protein n=1 Tax=Picea sitchensis TaxID=3332 RepID=A9NU63_PICSI|nr:unknown [Picea sitchensis]